MTAIQRVALVQFYYLGLEHGRPADALYPGQKNAPPICLNAGGEADSGFGIWKRCGIPADHSQLAMALNASGLEGSVWYFFGHDICVPSV